MRNVGAETTTTACAERFSRTWRARLP